MPNIKVVEQKLKKIGEILDNIASQNIDKLDHFHSELEKKHKLLDQKHENLLKKHMHLSQRDSIIKQRHANLKLKEKEYTNVLNLKKGLDRKSKRLAQFHKDITEKRQNIDNRIFQEKLKIEQSYREKEKQLQDFMEKLNEKDRQLNKDIINLEVEKIRLLQSLNRKPRQEKLVPGSAVDLWPMQLAASINQDKVEEYKQVLKDMPSAEFAKEIKKCDVKLI